MKIIFVINSSYPNYSGGIENWLYNASKVLVKNNVYVDIISKDDCCFPNYYTNIDSRISIFKVKSLISFKIFRRFIRSYLYFFDMILSSFFIGKKINKLTKNDNSNFYVVALDSLFCVFASKIAKSSNKNLKIISSVRGPHGDIYGERFPLFKYFISKWELHNLSSVDLVWANGYDTQYSLKNVGIFSEIMFNGIDFEKLLNLDPIKLNLSHNDFVIISVGSLLPIKGIFELIDALSILTDHGGKYHVFFVGKGDQKRYREYSISKNVSNRVHFIGHVEDPIRYIKSANICACLSGGGGLSMAALEALNSGIPVVGWNSPVYQQFNCDGVRRIHLVNKNDKLDLFKKINYIKDNYDFCLNESKSNTLYTKQFDWNIIADNITTALKKL